MECSDNVQENVSIENKKKFVSASKFFPWRRYFARLMDLVIYDMLFRIFCILVFRIESIDGGIQIFYTIVSLLIMIMIEPVLISKFGTTLGKFTFGIYIRDYDDKLLSYKEAFRRTRTVMIFGLGLQIPFVSLYTNWKSYRHYKTCLDLPWEDYSKTYLKDKNVLRFVCYLGVLSLLVVALVVCDQFARMPAHRGDISVADFVENYNNYLDYDDIKLSKDVVVFDDVKETRRLDNNGQFEVYSGNNMPNLNNYDVVNISYIEEDGIMTGFEFTLVGEGNNEMYTPFIYETVALLTVFIKTQDDYDFLSEDYIETLEYVLLHYYEDFEITTDGINISQDVEIKGYDNFDGIMLYPIDGEEQYYKYTLKVVDVE